MKKTLLFYSFILVVLCGFSQKETYTKKNYDINIQYESIPMNDNRLLKNDSLVILFDGNFKNDSIDVFVDTYKVRRMVLNTDPIDGVAGEFRVDKYNDIESIGFRINNGKLILIELEKEHYNIRFTYLDNAVTIRFYRILPAPM